MTIYERERNGRPVNPALALYKFWRTVLVSTIRDSRDDPLTQHLRGSTHLGVDGWRIGFYNEGPLEQPNITFGSFRLTSKGEFQLVRPHGFEQRNAIARGTFLEWNHWRGYNWFVDTKEPPNMPWIRTGGRLQDWTDPMHYVSEPVMGARRSYWTKTRPWMKLVWSDEFGWHINFARSEYSMTGLAEADPIGQEHFDRFEVIRQTRYRLLERDTKLASGDLIREGRHVITPEERTKRREEQAQIIMANLTVSQPVRTIPLRREREEGLWPLPLGSP